MNANHVVPRVDGAHDRQAPRVLLLGSRGYLGRHFRTLYPAAMTPRVDIADAPQVRLALHECRPDVVINCAGRCGTPNVDWCEDHRLETLHANVTGALVLLEECLLQKTFLVHMSSGCIYMGDNGGAGYAEDDAPNFSGSYYARTKSWTDQIFREFPVLTLRLRMPFDDSLDDRNLLMKLRGYRRVLTTPNSLTCLPDFLRAAHSLIEHRAMGVFNIVNPGAISPYEVMEMYKDIVDPEHVFEPLAAEQMGEVARAPRSNCILDTSRLENHGVFLPPVLVAVEEALRSLARKLGAESVTERCVSV